MYSLSVLHFVCEQTPRVTQRAVALSRACAHGRAKLGLLVVPGGPGREANRPGLHTAHRGTTRATLEQVGGAPEQQLLNATQRSDQDKTKVPVHAFNVVQQRLTWCKCLVFFQAVTLYLDLRSSKDKHQRSSPAPFCQAHPAL